MKRRVTLALLFLFCGVLFSSANAQVRPVSEKIRVVYSAIGASQTTVWIPYEGGIFRQHGLDIELLYVGGGSRAAQVLLSGEIAVGVFSGASVVSANLAGGDLVMIAGGIDVMPFFLVVRPEIKQVEDLRGKKVGVSRFGSTTDFALRFAAEKWPVKPDRDFAVLQLGGLPEMMAAVVSGGVDAAMLNAEFSILAQREGYKHLVDMAAVGAAFPTGSLNTSRSFIRKNEDTVRRLVRAYVEGIYYAKTHREFSVGVLRKYLKNQDRAFLDAVYEMYVQRFVPRVPYPSPEGVRTVLRQLGERDARARVAAPPQFLEPRFIQELEKEGFIQQLWK